MRVIFHLDLDSFFVSAERLQNPALVGKPVAVGGGGGRGVISSCSYEARKFGVRSAMPTAQALKLAPSLILVPHSFGLYSKLSREVFQLLDQFSPLIEQISIDEAYLDMTGSALLFGEPKVAAEKIRAVVRAATGLPCSIGIGPNRLLAKMATERAKPNGVFQVLESERLEFMRGQPLRAIPGVGPAFEEALKKAGLFRTEDVQTRSPEYLEALLGNSGTWIHRRAHGLGSTEFNVEPKSRSFSRETTFDKNLSDPKQLERELRELTAQLGSDLRSENVWPKNMRLKLRLPHFETTTRSRKVERPTRIDSELCELIVALFYESWDGTPLRLVGVGCEISEEFDYQWQLFDRPEEFERKDRLERLKDEIQSKFGGKSIQRGSILYDDENE